MSMTFKVQCVGLVGRGPVEDVMSKLQAEFKSVDPHEYSQAFLIVSGFEQGTFELKKTYQLVIE